MVDIYNYQTRLRSIEKNIQESKEISEVNKKLISQFKNECFAQNIGLARIVRYHFCLRDIAIVLQLNFSVFNRKI